MEGIHAVSLGPGKYGDLCTRVREDAQAKAAIVIVRNLRARRSR